MKQAGYINMCCETCFLDKNKIALNILIVRGNTLYLGETQ